MSSFNTAKLDQAVSFLRQTLGDGLIATDIWDETGRSYAGYNQQPAAVEVFNTLTASITQTLSGAGFPGLNSFYLLDLDADHMVAVIQHADHMTQGILMKTSKTNKGLLISVAMPGLTKRVEEARL